MLDLKFIRENTDAVHSALKKRGVRDIDLEEFLALDSQCREVLGQVDEMRRERNVTSDKIARFKKEGNPAEALIAQMKVVSQNIKELDAQVEDIKHKLNSIQLIIPNIPHDGVPVGAGASDNKVVREWGEKPVLSFTPLPHWDLAGALDIIDFPRAVKLSGSGFALYKGLGARLQRALITFMLDIHTEKHGYREIFPPYLVTRECMTGTGQLPKLEEDMYRTVRDDFFLIPTAEVPVTNIHRNEILTGDKLPLYYTAYTACFRREAGSYGKDTRGLMRVHQFDKVELVKFVKPETSYAELEKLLCDAEEILQQLGLHYRVIELCTADLSFAAAKCYDIEVWAPGLQRYLEVSSCSNYEDFQARRSDIRFRPEPGAKVEFVHTLNGSGIALPRTIAAILESYQQQDGSITVPQVLRSYLGGIEVIK